MSTKCFIKSAVEKPSQHFHYQIITKIENIFLAKNMLDELCPGKK